LPKETLVSKPDDLKKIDREELTAFRSNLAKNVRSMLDGFSRVRKDQVEKARNERRAALLEIKNQVAGIHKGLPQDKVEELPQDKVEELPQDKVEELPQEIVSEIVTPEAPFVVAEQEEPEKEDWPNEPSLPVKTRKKYTRTKPMTQKATKTTKTTKKK